MDGSSKKRKICVVEEEDEDEDAKMEKVCELVKNIRNYRSHLMSSSSSNLMEAIDFTCARKKTKMKKKKKINGNEEENNKAWRPSFLVEDFIEDHQAHQFKVAPAEASPVENGRSETTKEIGPELDLNLSL